VLHVSDLTVEAGHRLLVGEVSFTVGPGEVVGLVGPNGAGKTTLLSTIAAEARGRGARPVTLTGPLAWLPQESPPVNATTGLERMLSVRGIDQLQAQVETARRRIDSAPDQRARDRAVRSFANLQERFEVEGGYRAEAEARQIAAGLGLPPALLGRPLSALSGGERRRVELARVLFSEAATLLLDEPTNHLDTDAKQWLAGFLAAFPGGVLVVSHDLPLLDRNLTAVLVLDPMTASAETYKGTLSEYRAASEIRAASEAKRRRVLERDIKRLSAFVERYRHSNETMARRAMVTERRVEKLKATLTPERKRHARVVVRFPDPPPVGRVALEVQALARSYGGPPVFADLSFDLGRGERLLILGLNGAGKSSLLRMLAGFDPVTDGRVLWGYGARFGYYAQEHEGLDLDATPMELLRATARQPDGVLRGVLGHFLLGGDQADQRVRTLSGGEKTKLALARLVVSAHNVLLLDEPTNNLDVQAVEALRSALATYRGAVVLVSHDTPFVESFGPGRVLIMPEGGVDVWREEHAELIALD
jgi:ATPase subunit of ABC transporter with duplicated ATPase domains